MGGRRAIKRLVNQLPETAAAIDMTIEGQGVASVAGKRVFIDGVIRGETVTFCRTRSKRNYDEARLVEVVAASPDRVEPRCGYFGTCGGCSLQHLSATAQLLMKERTLLESLERIGSVVPERILPPVESPPWGYRRRARLAVRYVDGKGRVLIGFSERNSSWITDMRTCETLHPAVAALLEPLSGLIGALALRQRIPQVEVVVADNATVLVLRVLEDPPPGDRASLRAFGERHDVRILLQRGRPDQLEPPDPEQAPGELWYELPGMDLHMSFAPADFIQVNAAVNARLIELALQLIGPGPGMRVLDLFCGIGNFTLPLARRAGFVLGVEGDAAMVARARHNASLNGIGNAAFEAADLGREDAAMAWAGQLFDAILLDPPRAGAAAMLGPVARTGARRVAYVSCHPGTLARDAATLVHELGFRLSAAGVLDMFPATSHVESVALFERT